MALSPVGDGLTRFWEAASAFGHEHVFRIAIIGSLLPVGGTQLQSSLGGGDRWCCWCWCWCTPCDVIAILHHHRPTSSAICRPPAFLRLDSYDIFLPCLPDPRTSTSTSLSFTPDPSTRPTHPPRRSACHGRRRRDKGEYRRREDQHALSRPFGTQDKEHNPSRPCFRRSPVQHKPLQSVHPESTWARRQALFSE